MQVGWAERSPCGSLAAVVVLWCCGAVVWCAHSGSRSLAPKHRPQCRNGAATGTDKATDTLGRRAIDRRLMRESVGETPARPCRACQTHLGPVLPC